MDVASCFVLLQINSLDAIMNSSCVAYVGVLEAQKRTTLPALISGFLRRFEDREVQLNTVSLLYTL